MPSALATKILVEGSDDWVPLGALYGWAKHVAGDSDEEQRRTIVAALVELIGEGMIIPGDVVNGRGFVPRRGSLDDVLAEVEHRVTAGSHEDFLLWFANTGKGDSTVAQLNAANRNA